MNPEVVSGRKHLITTGDGSEPGIRALYFMILGAAVLFPACTQPAPVETREDGRLPIFHRTQTPVYFPDLSRAQPDSVLTRREKRRAWRLIDYETEDFKGTLLFAGEETEAPDVTLSLDTAGVHDVYVGMFNTAWRPYQNMNVRARLSGDPAFSMLFLPAPDFGHGPKIGAASWQFGIAADSDKKDGATAFIEFAIQDQYLAAFSNGIGLIPATSASTAMTANYAAGGPLEIFFEYSNRQGLIRPPTPGYVVMARVFEKALADIANGADVGETLDAAVDEIDADIEANGGYGF